MLIKTKLLGWLGDRAGLRNRVYSKNLGEDTKIIAETRFLGWFATRATAQ